MWLYQGSYPAVIKHRRPGPSNPADGIPSSEWPAVLRRVLEKKEPLRQVADESHGSHETIRRVIRAAPWMVWSQTNETIPAPMIVGLLAAILALLVTRPWRLVGEGR